MAAEKLRVPPEVFLAGLVLWFAGIFAAALGVGISIGVGAGLVFAGIALLLSGGVTIGVAWWLTSEVAKVRPDETSAAEGWESA